MDKYSLYCTMAQTKSAIELGAPVIKVDTRDKRMMYCDNMCFPIIADYPYAMPTTEQMINWLEEMNVKCFIVPDIYKDDSYNIQINDTLVTTGHTQYNYPLTYDTRKEATIAVIDAALDYLSNSKSK